MHDCPEKRDCDKKFAEISTMLKTIDESLRGNGKVGLCTRVDRLERSWTTTSRLVWLLVGVGLVQIVNMLWGA